MSEDPAAMQFLEGMLPGPAGGNGPSSSVDESSGNFDSLTVGNPDG